MRIDLGKKTLLYPMPVLIIGTYDSEGTPNAMNAAWGGISDTNQIMICLSPEHKTVKNILERKAFTVSMGEVCNLVESDYVGIASGNTTVNKLERAHITTTKSKHVDAPILNEYHFTLECNLISYDEDSCHLFGEIVNVSADESILTDQKVDLSKFKPITYDSMNHTYVSLGEVVGAAFKDGKKIK